MTANLANGRGVYSFCMCPGGYVVNASSEEDRLAVNGMSYSGRDGKNANSAIIVAVTPDDFAGKDPLAGVRFQEMLEERAFAIGKGRIPQQLFGDYCSNRASVSYGAFESAAKGACVLGNLRGLLPQALEESFIEGMHAFSRRIPAFDREDAILSGVGEPGRPHRCAWCATEASCGCRRHLSVRRGRGLCRRHHVRGDGRTESGRGDYERYGGATWLNLHQ